MNEAGQEKLLKSATQWQKKPVVRCFEAGREAAFFLQQRAGQLNRNALLVDAWEELIPPGLKRWCRLDSLTGHVLTVQAAPGPYMHQLRIMQNELLAELARRCPQAAVRKLRIIPLKQYDEEH
ncbi:MAG: DUF721 domain-containing protein [Planctomycetes bacterium]|jgi:predicted nucleic acid-binding Zn ribbon protein|nr:DUF721 domain-containing protein [Planctomycetota bacterium]